eukprot:2767021-Pyramimonas_sp.AAC.1
MPCCAMLCYAMSLLAFAFAFTFAFAFAFAWHPGNATGGPPRVCFYLGYAIPVSYTHLRAHETGAYL